MILVVGNGKSVTSLKNYLNKNNILYHNCDSGILYEYIIKGPGVLKETINAKGKIICDIEYFYLKIKSKIIGITGTNGKTTTSYLIHHLIKKDIPSKLCGNMGIPVFDEVGSELKIMELSSFMLESTISFKPNIAIILNINEAHLDYHKTFRNYIDSKLKIIKNLGKDDLIIYNLDDFNIDITNQIAKKMTFSVKSKMADIYLEDGYICYGQQKIKAPIDHILALNMMPSILVASYLGISFEKIESELLTFEKPKYRFEKIALNIYNDAKSTNFESTFAALKCLTDVVLIAGGYDRYEDLDKVKLMVPYLKKVYLYGATRLRFKTFFEKNGVNVILCETLTDVIYDLHLEDTILYSPMAPSYDQYDSFEQRGYEFSIKIQKRLKDSSLSQ